MKAVILNGGAAGDELAAAIAQALQESLQGLGFEPKQFDLAEMELAYCLGDFKCWTRTPGICALADDNRMLARFTAQADLLLYVTTVTFGGYSSQLKKAVDHLIQIASPYFSTIGGETHHKKRYDHTPMLFAVGILPAPDPEAEDIFATLVNRNGINFHNLSSACFVYRNRPVEEAAKDAVEELQLWTKMAECSSSSEVPGA